MLRQNGRTIMMKAWNFAERAAELPAGARVDVAFALEDDSYAAARGLPAWGAVLRDAYRRSGITRTSELEHRRVSASASLRVAVSPRRIY